MEQRPSLGPPGLGEALLCAQRITKCFYSPPAPCQPQTSSGWGCILLCLGTVSFTIEAQYMFYEEVGAETQVGVGEGLKG